MRRGGTWVAVAWTGWAVACGGANDHEGTREAPRPVTVEPAAFLEEVGAASSVVLQRPRRSLEELEQARRDARGQARRLATRDAVVGLVFAASEAEGREARRLRRRAERLADAAVRGSRDASLRAEIAFAKLWLAWRAGSRLAERRAERFTTRHRESGDLLTLAWMIRGEIAFTDERYEDAVEAYRFALGNLGHPLYAFALFRTAHAHRRLGHEERATQAFDEVEQLGCGREVPRATLRIATAAASERGSGLRIDTDGVTRPARCPSPEELAVEPADEGWRPAE
ncbi:MAG TPA: hypothetical protein RMH99_09440 [Sandaracinaceae bacterium LLY-WYZ-13_1]|nr:hypothetical protein [Sandaracinaceae bacterium LLY-WYZ-13_1]